MAAGLGAEELGGSFAIQSYGDLAARRAPVLTILLFTCACHVICVPAACFALRAQSPTALVFLCSV